MCLTTSYPTEQPFVIYSFKIPFVVQPLANSRVVFIFSNWRNAGFARMFVVCLFDMNIAFLNAAVLELRTLMVRHFRQRRTGGRGKLQATTVNNLFK